MNWSTLWTAIGSVSTLLAALATLWAAKEAKKAAEAASTSARQMKNEMHIELERRKEEIEAQLPRVCYSGLQVWEDLDKIYLKEQLRYDIEIINLRKKEILEIKSAFILKIMPLNQPIPEPIVLRLKPERLNGRNDLRFNINRILYEFSFKNIRWIEIYGFLKITDVFLKNSCWVGRMTHYMPGVEAIDRNAVEINKVMAIKNDSIAGQSQMDFGRCIINREINLTTLRELTIQTRKGLDNSTILHFDEIITEFSKETSSDNILREF